MKQFILKHKGSVAGISACLLLGILTLSFQDSPFVHSMIEQSSPLQDTVPVKKSRNSMTMKEFDRLAENLDNQVAKELKNIDFAKMEQEIRSSLKEVDVEKIMKEVEGSLKEINTEKILADVKKELENINFEDVHAETKEALEKASVELDKAREEIRKINMDEIRKELANAQKEMEKSREEFKNIDMPKIMREAQEGIDKAKQELKQIKAMFNEMEKDGLINSKKGFKIEYKDKNLFINGTKQPEQVTDKYRKYFKDDHFEITIDKE